MNFNLKSRHWNKALVCISQSDCFGCIRWLIASVCLHVTFPWGLAVTHPTAEGKCLSRCNYPRAPAAHLRTRKCTSSSAPLKHRHKHWGILGCCETATVSVWKITRINVPVGPCFQSQVQMIVTYRNIAWEPRLGCFCSHHERRCVTLLAALFSSVLLVRAELVLLVWTGP